MRRTRLFILLSMFALNSHALTRIENLYSASKFTKHFSLSVARLGGVLEIVDMWDDPRKTLLSYREGKKWQLLALGGFARLESLKLDAYELMMCHEYAHHVGGFPFLSEWGWASSEGQSDYIASFYCLKKIWAEELELNQESANVARPITLELCDSAYKAQQQRDLCYRILNAAESWGQILSPLTPPQIDTPDPGVVVKTWHGHSSPQCRVDTVVAGALCNGIWNEQKIPGLNNPQNQRSVNAEQEALPYACHNRPKCWYASRFY